MWSSVEYIDVFPWAIYENFQGLYGKKCKTRRQHVRRVADLWGVGVHLVVSPWRRFHQPFCGYVGGQRWRWTHRRSLKIGPVDQFRAGTLFEAEQFLYLEHHGYETVGGQAPRGPYVHRARAHPDLPGTWSTCATSRPYQRVPDHHHSWLGACQARQIGPYRYWARCRPSIQNGGWVGICQGMQSDSINPKP
jgi:hypothetical protein